MKKILLTWLSRTGNTEAAATWIRDGIKGCDAKNWKSVTDEDIAGYDVIVWGAGVYAGTINGLDKAMERCRGKKFVLYVTGGTPNSATEDINIIWDKNLGKKRDRIPHFYIQSGLCYEKMSFRDKIMMKIAAKMMESQRIAGDGRRSMKESYDIFDERYVKPLVDFVNENYNY